MCLQSAVKQVDIQSVKLLDEKTKFNHILSENPDNFTLKLDSILKKSTLVCFITSNDSLIYWNTNKVQVSTFDELTPDGKIHVVNLSIGWYLYSANILDNKTIYLLNLIKSDYQVNNKFLVKTFNPEYPHSHNVDIILDKAKSSSIIYDNEGEFLFGVKFK